MPVLPPDASPAAIAEEARAQAYRLQTRRRATARAIRERQLAGDPAARRLLTQHWAPMTDPVRDIGDPDNEQQQTAING